ncbi:fatty acid synthase [Caerostris extrusa]|uniref:Fatty acid synthase n=1 Tax=Caerostris extrusa TaxID=172846 RepID=A0AAV4Y7B7_CAEEX|nr:fatty acid synthase [Caerostris extrusa]
MDTSLDHHHEYCTGGFDPDDVVITGMSGRFPDCESIAELRDGIYNKRNLIKYSSLRFEKGDYNAPYDSCGLIKTLDKLDINFFRVPHPIAQRMDPAARIHLEVCYEAIADAGFDAADLRGENIGIFNATTHDDTIKINTTDESFISLHAIRTMNPNRTSYSLDFTGPSFTVDSACSSSSVAFWSAVNSIRAGHVDAAIVSGCQLNLHPSLLVGYMQIGIASAMGNSRPFDASSDGMLKTEAVNALFLQKAKHARRVYASVPAVRFYSAGYMPEGINVPSDIMETKLIIDTLKEANVDPNEIQYVEAHGTGTQVGDRNEINAVHGVFQRDPTRPILVGTIKSNIGHTEASSGICGMIKSLLAFESGLIAPNFKYDVPNPKIPGLLEGRVAVVTEPTPLHADYIPVNCLGFGGTLVEVLLKKNPITYKNKKDVQQSLPRLVLFPGTIEDAITTVLEYVENNPDLPEEFFALLNKLSFTEPFRKPIRGYGLYQKGKKSS